MVAPRYQGLSTEINYPGGTSKGMGVGLPLDQTQAGSRCFCSSEFLRSKEGKSELE